MELTQAILRIGIINVVINILVNLSGSWLIFRRVSEQDPAPVFASGLTPSLFGDLLVSGFLMGLVLSWIMVVLARNWVRVERLYVQESKKIDQGKKWKTNGFIIGLIAAFSVAALLLIIGIPLSLIFKDVTVSSLWMILVIKSVYSGGLAVVLTWICLSVSAKSQDAFRRAGLHQL